MSDWPGFFAVIDGPSGVGKTTVTQHVRMHFATRGMSVLTTRQPSGSPIGKLARTGTRDYSGLVLACLVAADRYDHLNRHIRPALQRGELVLCDRYLSRSLVLQVGDGVSEEMIWQLNSEVDHPDLTIILVGDPELARRRAMMRGTYSRFHEGGAEAGTAELARYRAIGPMLEARGMPTHVYEIGECNGSEVAREVAQLIKRAMSGRRALALCGANE